MKKNGVFGSWYVIVLVVLYNCCNSSSNSNSNSNFNSNSNSSKTSVWGIVMLRSILLGTTTGFGCALVCALFVRCIFKYIKRVPILKGPVVFSPEISPKSLQSALTNPDSTQTQTQTHHISGNYYKLTLLDNGVTVAVKKLHPITFSIDENKNKKRRRIQNELEILGGLRHRHLMKLRAYVYDETNNSFCLVYDYVHGGSLEDAMRTRREQIGWDGRLRIAVGIIKGLDYLHLTSICHYNLKPSNVMLDADFEPTLADCGFPPTSNSHDGSGYYAPESYPDFSIYNSKSDIFSFGVILGILLTGRDPWDPLFGGDMGVWLRQVVEAGDAREALDKSLLGEEMEEDEMLMAVRIAAVCLSHTPADRPSSHQLVPMLTQLNSF